VKREWPGNFRPGNKNWVPLLLGCIPDEGLIYPREHNNLSKKSDSRGKLWAFIEEIWIRSFLE